MSERSLPPTPRRRAAARRAGQIAHAPTLTTAAAWAGALCAALATAPAQLAQLRAELSRALLGALAAQGAGASSLVSEATHAALAALALAAPVVAGAAVAAVAAHLAQVRAWWVPRRRIEGAPRPPHGGGARVLAASWALVRGLALLAAGLGWLWASAPRLGVPLSGGVDALTASASVLASALLVLAVTWTALGALELVGRSLALAAALRMTPAERRQEERESGGGIAAWRARQPRQPGQPFGPLAPGAGLGATRRSLRDATVLVLGDGEAAAVRWEPRHSPEPQLVLTRRGAAVTYALALARQAGVPVVRAPELAQLLARAADDGTTEVPAAARAALAELVVAVRGGGRAPLGVAPR